MEDEFERQMQLFEEYVASHPYERSIISFMKSIGTPTWMQDLIKYQEPEIPDYSPIVQARSNEERALMYGIIIFAVYCWSILMGRKENRENS